MHSALRLRLFEEEQCSALASRRSTSSRPDDNSCPTHLASRCDVACSTCLSTLSPAPRGSNASGGLASKNELVNRVKMSLNKRGLLRCVQDTVHMFVVDRGRRMGSCAAACWTEDRICFHMLSLQCGVDALVSW